MGDLQEEVKNTRDCSSSLRKLEAYLYKVQSGQDREKIQGWIQDLTKKQERQVNQTFDSFMKTVNSLVEKGDIKEALFKLENPPAIIKKTKYAEKIVEKIGTIKGSQGIYSYTFSILEKASKMAKNRRYEIALAILNTFEVVDANKPDELRTKVESLKEKISREKDTYREELKKLAALPWYSVIHKDDLYNWDYKPAGRDYWDVKDSVIRGKGAGVGAKASWLVLLTIPKDAQGLDNYEGEELKNYIYEFQFQILSGLGFDCWGRVIRDDNKLTPLAITTSDFKRNIWYTLRIEVRGDKIHIFCPTNLHEKEGYAKSPSGTLGFMVYENTTIQLRNFRLKILPF